MSVDGVDIYAIPAFDLYMLQDGGSPHNILQQDYVFHISTKDFLTNSIGVKSNITLTSFGIEYAFSVRTYTDTLLGWHFLFLNKEGKSSV